MSGQFLVYFADPMCSWCYGFGPELDALLIGRPGLRVDLVMGFPTLALGYPDGRYFLVASGFARAAEIAGRLDQIGELAETPLPPPDQDA